MAIFKKTPEELFGSGSASTKPSTTKSLRKTPEELFGNKVEEKTVKIQEKAENKFKPLTPDEYFPRPSFQQVDPMESKFKPLTPSEYLSTPNRTQIPTTIPTSTAQAKPSPFGFLTPEKKQEPLTFDKVMKIIDESPMFQLVSNIGATAENTLGISTLRKWIGQEDIGNMMDKRAEQFRIDNPIASYVTQAGTYMLPLGAGMKLGTKILAPTLGKAAPIVAGAGTAALFETGKGTLEQRPPEEIAKNAATSAAFMFAGGGATSALEKLGTKILFNTPQLLKNSVAAEMTKNVLSGAGGGVVGGVVANQVNNPGQLPPSKQILHDALFMGVLHGFNAIPNTLEQVRFTNQRLYTDSVKFSNDMAKLNAKAEIEPKINKKIEYYNEMKNEIDKGLQNLNNRRFVGNNKVVKDIQEAFVFGKGAIDQKITNLLKPKIGTQSTYFEDGIVENPNMPSNPPPITNVANFNPVMPPTTQTNIGAFQPVQNPVKPITKDVFPQKPLNPNDNLANISTENPSNTQQSETYEVETTEPETGKPFTKTVYQGRGKAPVDIYSYVQYPILGKGDYYAFDSKKAENYGDKISTTKIKLENPLVIQDDVEWRQLTSEAGWKYPNPYGQPAEEIINQIDNLQDFVKSQGYDGIVVNFDKYRQGDINQKTGNSVRTITNVLDHDQIISFKQTEPIQQAPEQTTPSNESWQDLFGPTSNIDTATTPQVPGIDDRNFEDVKHQKPIQQLRPELAPYIQKEAGRLLTEIGMTIPGEKTPIKDWQGYIIEYTGTKRQTSDSIARILDNLPSKPTYKEIQIAIQKIIKDGGEENNALSKRIELIIDDNLVNGTIDIQGNNIAPDEEYINERNKQPETVPTETKPTKEETTNVPNNEVRTNVPKPPKNEPSQNVPQNAPTKQPNETHIRNTGEGKGAGSKSDGAGSKPQPSDGTSNARPTNPIREESKPEPRPESEPIIRVKGNDYIIESQEDVITSKGKKTRFESNVKVIETMKQIMTEGRAATSEEQKIMAQYVGWGGIPEAFTRSDSSWTKEYEKLKELLTEKEHFEANQTILNAHYTSIPVIKGMFEGLKHFGYTGGRVIEPSAGIGNFIGSMPLMDRLKTNVLTGIEIDIVTGNIAKLLYPSSDIRVEGFENAKIPNNYYDVAISNVPFGQIKVIDNRYPKNITASIHNYFFARALDVVRPGGLIMFITSKNTLDSMDTSGIREYIKKKADFVGAVRLPNVAFEENAGTKVTTDIIVLKKRESNTEYEGQDFFKTKTTDFGIDNSARYVNVNKYEINEYYINHPENIMGNLRLGSGLYGVDVYVESDNRDLQKSIAEAFKKMPGNIIDYSKKTNEDIQGAANKKLMDANKNTKNGSYEINGGKIYVNRDGKLVEVTEGLSPKDVKKIKAIITLKNNARDLLNEELKSGKYVDSFRKYLNDKYDQFVKEYGYLNKPQNLKLIFDDPDISFILAMENYDRAKKTATKSSIFTQNTVSPVKPVTSVDNAKDGLSVSLVEDGIVNLEKISMLYGKPLDEVKAELKGLIFKNPSSGQYEPSDIYLSGNVKSKLYDAEALAINEPEYKDNVEALKQIIPPDKEGWEMSVKMGSPLISDEAYIKFAKSLFGDRAKLQISQGKFDGQWYVKDIGEGRDSIGNKTLNTDTWGIDRIGFKGLDLLRKVMNNKSIVVKDTVEDFDGTKRTVVNQKQTALAQSKAESILETFEKWIATAEDGNIFKGAIKNFNDIYNTEVLRKVDGSHLPDVLPGMNPFIVASGTKLQPHQKDAIWRNITSSGPVMIAHEVGAGKTFEMIATAMEFRRLGIAKKPLIVVPKNIIEQWGIEFRRLYPGAKILVPTAVDFQTKNRKVLMNKIALGDYDSIIITGEQLKSIDMSAEAIEKFIGEKLVELREALEIERADRISNGEWKRSLSEKGIIAAIKRLDTLMKEKIAKIKKDTNNISFEELGIDALFVDEAHKYKNLMFNTKMQVSGLGSKEGNDKTFDLLMKVRHLQKLNGGKGIVFATATPILNSISESYNWFQYLHPKLLEARGIRSFDQFISVFGKVEDVAEITPDGTGYRIKKGISKITNVGQLATLFRSFVDFKTQEMLKLPRPDVKGGDYQVIEVEATEWQKKYIKTLAKRAEALKNGGIDPKVDNMLMVTSDGRKAALHPGLIDPNFELLPGETTKIETAINHLFEHWKKTTKEKLTHLVFIEMSTPKAKKESKKAEEDDETDNFDEVDKKTESVYRQVKDGLIKKGIPKNEIAFIHDAKNPAQKIALKNKFNSGEVRILIGNNEKMGVGIDLQTRTKTITHIDYPWRPKDLQQEDGRALRQGNINKEIETFVIITKRSFDARIWDNLQRKSNVIDGFLNADINDVEIEDPSATTLTAQEISAIASDNPLMKEQVIVTKQLQKLNFEKRGFADARAKLIEKIPYLKSQIEYYTRKLNEYKNLEGKVENITGDNFKAVIDGKTFDKFGEAETYFNELVSKKGENLKYAEADTFEFKLANVIDKVILVQTSQDKNVSRIGLTWKSGDVSITETDTFRGITTTVGNIRRSIERFTQTNNEYQNELDAIYKQLEKKFTKDQEIKELTSRANEIMSILNPEQVIGDGEGEDEYIEEGEVTTATARPMDADQIRTELTSNFPEHTSSEEGVKDLDTAAEALRDLQEVEGSEIPGDRGTLGRNKYEVKVIGNAITTEAIKTGKIQITGAKVENVQQLAVIAQAFRDPRFETLRYVFVDGEGVIVHVESISSCIAGSCVINPYIKPFSEYSEEGDKWIIGINVRKDNEKWFKELAQIMKDKQATGYYLIHNHPSGFPEASKGDVTATDTVDKSLPGFISHIILDSNKYVELKKNPDKPNGYMGTEKEHKFHEEDLILKASKEHPLLSKKIESANDLSKIALELKGSDKYSTLVHVNAKLYVQGIEEVPNEMLKDTEYFKDFLKSRNIEFGSAMSFVVTNDKLSYEATKADMIKEAYIEDVLYVSSENQIKSYRQDNSKVNPKDGFWMGKRTSDYPTIRLEEIKERYNKRPFFSQLQRVIEEKLPSRIDKSALLGLISNPKNGIKQEEVKWSGLKDFIINKDKIDKKELLEFLRMNEIEIEETIFDNEEIVLEKKIKIATTKYIIEKYNLKELRSELNEYETQDVTYENKFFQVKFEMKDGYIKDLLSYDLIVPEDSEYLGTTTAIQYLEEEFLLEFREDYLEPIRTNIQKRTKHDKFQVVGGGQNYKELLFILKNKDLKQLPKGYQTKQTEDGRWTVVNNNGDSMGSYDSEAEAVDLVLKTSQELIKPKSYISPQSHWKELNVLAFTRFNDRYDSNGDNVLFLEEIQSDWHQEGRKKGYKKNLTEQDKESIADKLKKIHKLNEDIIKIKKNSPIGKELRLETRKSQGVFGIETEYLLIKGKNQVLIRAETEDYAWLNINSFNLFTKLYDSEKLLLDKIKLEINKIREEINEIEFQDSKIPDAPFKTTWHEFVLKRMIRYAAENGYDYLSWTTGNQQNERYNLKESVKEIAYWKENDDVFGLSIMGMNGNLIIVQKYLKADELEETFGNNIANKILNKEGKKRSNNFPPSDTKNVKYLTGDNLQIGGSGMKAFYDKMIPQFLNKYAKRWNTQVQTIEINGVTQQALPITLEMKDSVMIEGQSLFEEKDEYKPLTSENELELPPASGLNTSGKAKRASEIIGEFEKKFMNKVRVGKINRKNVLGYLQVRTHVIRLRKANDIPTFTHEAGHLIDKMYKLSDVQDRGIINELVRLGKMTTNSQKERVQIDEGIAEFTRLYLTDNVQAFARAPKTFEYYKRTIDPDFLGFLNERMQDISDLVNLSPEERVMRDVWDKAEVDKQRAKGETLNLKLSQFYTQMVDEYYPAIKVAVELGGVEGKTKIKQIIAATKGYESTAMFSINPKGIKGLYQSDLNHNEVGPSLFDVLLPLANDNKKRDFFWKSYAIGRRAEDYHARNLALPQDIQTYRDTVKNLEEKYPDFPQIFQAVRKYDDNLLLVLTQAGFFDKKQANEIRKQNPNHIHLFRVLDDGIVGVKSSKGNPVKSLRGGGQEILNPYESMVNMTFVIWQAAKRQELLLELAKMADKVEGKGAIMVKAPFGMKATTFNLDEVKKKIIESLIAQDVDLEKFYNGFDIDMEFDMMAKIFRPNMIAGKNQLAIYKNGKINLYDVEPEIYKALSGMNPVTFNAIMKFLLKVSTRVGDFQAASILYDLRFVAWNTSREVLTAWLQTRAGIGVMDIMKGAISVMTHDKWFIEAMKRGGTTQMFLANESRFAKDIIDDMSRGRSLSKKIQKEMRHPLNTIRDLIQWTELGTKTAELKKTVKNRMITRFADSIGKGEFVTKLLMTVDPQIKAQWKQFFQFTNTTKEDWDEAIYNMRDLTYDLKRKGRFIKEGQINRIWRFSNAYIQGFDQTFRTATDPGRNKRLLLRGLMIAFISLMIHAYLNDNKHYKNLKPYQKDNFWQIPIGDPQKTPIFLPIPRGFEWAIPFMAVPVRAYEYFYKNDPEAWKGFSDSLKNNFTYEINPMPLRPFIEDMTNTQWSGIPIENSEDLKASPKYRYDEYTSNTARAIADVMNEIPFKSDILQSPKRVYHLIRGYTGSIGNAFLSAIDEVTGKSNYKASDLLNEVPGLKVLKDIPGINVMANRFLVDARRSNTISQDYYEGRDEAAMKMYDATEKGKIENDIVKHAVLNALYKTFDKSLSDLRKERGELEVERKPGYREEIKKIDANLLRMKEIMNIAKRNIEKNSKK